MKYGTMFPHIPLPDKEQTRARAQFYEAAGLDFITLGGHLLTAHPGRYDDRPVAYYGTPYPDPFVVFSYLAGVTSCIRFMSVVTLLPMLPTALVAKQALDLAFVSGNRFDLGIGTSWQEAEYRALGQDFEEREDRFWEQIDVLQSLWAQHFVEYKTRFHDIDGLGFDRIPDCPIPLWLGPKFDEARFPQVVGKVEGWMALLDPGDTVSRIAAHIPDGASFKVLSSMRIDQGTTATWIEEARRLQKAGVTHLTLTGDPQSPEGPDSQVVVEAFEILRRAKPVS